jgi:hypothetical protein
VERLSAWLRNLRRLRIRDERRAELHQAFMHLGGAVMCQRFLRASWNSSWMRAARARGLTGWSAPQRRGSLCRRTGPAR